MERKEILPENPENHIRIKPGIFNPRRYYLKKLLSLVQIARDKFIQKKYLKNQKLTLCDYGCGTMPYITQFPKEFVDYKGIDLSWNPYADFHIENNKILMHDLTADIVLSTQVLEHVEDYNSYLKEAYRILKDDGLLVITTHGYWMYHPDPTDYWRWTSDGLKKIIQDQSFEIIYFDGIIARGAMGMQLIQDGFYFKLPKFIRPIFGGMMQTFVSLLDKLSSHEARITDACTYLVVAKKKTKN
jgi:SAM-dependent methyltransferase